MVDELRDVRSALERAPAVEETPGLSRSAVAAIFSPGRRLWLIKRAERVGDPWSGHLGLPGGREQPTDPDLLRVAMRETHEELGLDLTQAELLGQLDDLRTRPVRSLVVRPYVFRWDGLPTFQPNHEVADVLEISLDRLLAGTGRGRMVWPGPTAGLPLPCVDVQGHRLWGLTLMILDDLLHRIDGRGMGLERPGG